MKSRSRVTDLPGKLVRDKIPELMKRQGQLAICIQSERILDRLCDKLVEETDELAQARDKPQILQECADVKEVLDELYRTRRMRMLQLPLADTRSYLDHRKALQACALEVARSTAAIHVLEKFFDLFAQMLDDLCITEQELVRKQVERRNRNGGYGRHLVHLYTIEPESLPVL